MYFLRGILSLSLLLPAAAFVFVFSGVFQSVSAQEVFLPTPVPTQNNVLLSPVPRYFAVSAPTPKYMPASSGVTTAIPVTPPPPLYIASSGEIQHPHSQPVTPPPPQYIIVPGVSSPRPPYPAPGPSPTPPPPIPPPGPSPIPTPVPDFCEFFSFLCSPADEIYLILGDSMALGSLGFPGYASRYEDWIEERRGIEIDSRNFGLPGATSADLANSLQRSEHVQSRVQIADIITWNIGGNDLRQARQRYYAGTCGGADNEQCLREAVANFRNNWDIIVREIQRQKKSEEVIVRSMDLYNPFVKEDMAQGTFFVFKPYFDQVNQHIATSLRGAGIPYISLSEAFNGEDGLTDPADLGYMAYDGYHPNSAGHRVISHLLTQL